ncbi:MAG: DUF4347 domain-containing protein [Janthinobacterium lividum]
MSRRCASEQFVFEEMEQRILYSADTAILAAAINTPNPQTLELPRYQSLALPTQTAASSSAGQQENATRHEVVFIDGAVDDAQDLASQLQAQSDAGRSLDVVVLDAATDGVAQISAYLANQQGLDAIHIISHGSDGALQLGAGQLDSGNLLANAIAVSGWGAALASGGDILLYGCDVAQTAAGQQFVDTLGKLTGADMEASTNLTGNAALHGDWTLEYSSGKIETALAPDRAIELGYSGILASFTVTSSADSGAGTLRQAILDANASSGSDTISFAIGSGAASIALLTQLPTITDVTVVDATTQAGYSNAPLIELSGAASASGTDGITVSGAAASGSSIRGLVINGFNNGITLTNVTYVTIEGNYIGTNAAGTAAVANAG